MSDWPASLWTPFRSSVIEDPYPMYRSLRAYPGLYPAPSGDWIVTRYSDIRAVLKDTSFLNGNRLRWLERGASEFPERYDVFQSILKAVSPFLVFQNGHYHQALRKFISAEWNTLSIGTVIEENIIHLWPSDSLFDLAPIAMQLPAKVMCDVMGIPEADFKKLEQLSHKMIMAFDLYLSFRNLSVVKETANAFLAYFQQLIEAKEQAPDDSLISKLIRHPLPDGVSRYDLLSNLFFLFISGVETTASLICHGVWHLSTRDFLPKLAADPTRISSAVEECLRFDPPAQLVARYATRDTTIAGTEIAKGDSLTICLASANRDESVYEEADRFSLDRDFSKHLAFSHGAHYCLGDWLARLEFSAVLSHVVKKKSFRVMSAPVWRPNLSVRSIQSLMVTQT